MNHTKTTMTTDALALYIADITAFTLEATDPPTVGASIAEAMATAGTLDLNAVEWAATIDDFCREGAEIERLEEEIDWTRVC